MVWVKGQSGNAGGAPKTKAFTEALRKQCLAPAESKFGLAKGHKRIDVIAMQIVKKAMSGDLSAIREIADRIEGRPPQSIAGLDDNGGVVKEFTVRFATPAELNRQYED